MLARSCAGLVVTFETVVDPKTGRSKAINVDFV